MLCDYALEEHDIMISFGSGWLPSKNVILWKLDYYQGREIKLLA
jgi:hypothetical protein